MPKGVVQSSIGGATAGTRLRDMIRKLEIDVVNMKGTREKVVDTLKLRDEVQEEYTRLNAQGLNLKAEKVRIDTIDNHFEANVGLMLSELKGVGGMEGARSQVNPPSENRWWFLDEAYLARKKKSSRTTIIAGVAIVVLLAAGLIVSNILFGPNARAAKARAHFINGQQYIDRGDLNTAVTEMLAAAEAQSGHSEALTYLSVLYEETGDDAKAAEYATLGQNAWRNRRAYMLSRADAYTRVKDTDNALATLDEVIEQNPESAEAYLKRAELYFGLNQPAESEADFARAATLAQESRNENVFNQAKLRQGIVLKTLTPASGG